MACRRTDHFRMEVIFLGTGTSQGVPMIACQCAVCTSADPRNHRTRTSIHVVMDGLHVQVDAPPEFRLQCLRESLAWVDCFILTHGHADHIAGMDDLRRFCDLLGGTALTVYSTEEGLGRVLAMYPYAMTERPIAKGYAAFRLETMPECLEISAETDQGEVMGVRHRDFIVEGVQFHPESILTIEGKRLLENFLRLAAPGAALAAAAR